MKTCEHRRGDSIDVTCRVGLERIPDGRDCGYVEGAPHMHELLW